MKMVELLQWKSIENRKEINWTQKKNTAMEQSTQNFEKVIKINESAVRDHLGKMVRSTVAETLNQMLDAEALIGCAMLTNISVLIDARKDTRAGHYQRKLHTKERFPSMFPNCAASHLKPQLLSGIVGGKLPSKNLLLRCILLVFPYVALKILPNHYGLLERVN